MQMYRLLNTEFLLAAVWDMSSSSHCLNKTAHCSIPTLKHASLYPHFKNAATSTAILMVCQKFKFLVQPLTSGLSLRRLEHVALAATTYFSRSVTLCQAPFSRSMTLCQAPYRNKQSAAGCIHYFLRIVDEYHRRTQKPEVSVAGR